MARSSSYFIVFLLILLPLLLLPLLLSFYSSFNSSYFSSSSFISSIFFTSSFSFFSTLCFPFPLQIPLLPPPTPPPPPPPPPPSSSSSFSSSSSTLQPFKFHLTTDVDSVQSKALVLHLFYTHTPQVQLNIGNPFNLRLTSPPPGQLSSNFLTVL